MGNPSPGGDAGGSNLPAVLGVVLAGGEQPQDGAGWSVAFGRETQGAWRKPAPYLLPRCPVCFLPSPYRDLPVPTSTQQPSRSRTASVCFSSPGAGLRCPSSASLPRLPPRFSQCPSGQDIGLSCTTPLSLPHFISCLSPLQHRGEPCSTPCPSSFPSLLAFPHFPIKLRNHHCILDGLAWAHKTGAEPPP